MEQKKQLTFMEAASIIVGHGVGSGILAVPYLASRNSWRDIILVFILCYCVNLLMHLMIAELSLNNHGAHFIKCFENELFTGKLKKIAVWICFLFLGLSVLMNVSGFIAGSAAVFESWLGLPSQLSMILYYVVASIVVLYGLKLVGICEKISVLSMTFVIGILVVAVILKGDMHTQLQYIHYNNIIALYSMVAFSLSAVMSVPQVVKGLDGNAKRVRSAIAAGTGINLGLMVVITVMTILGAGNAITENGALVDLSKQLGGWVSVVGYVFSLLALTTSFWANTLNLRDIVHEQIGLNVKVCYLICSVPCLILALIGMENFVGFTRLASVIQILTGIGIILSYHKSRKRVGTTQICGVYGITIFQIIVVISSVLSTVGALLKVY